MKKQCNHNRTWVICGGYGQWCFECGAFRGTNPLESGLVTGRTSWVSPVGAGGESPYSKMRELKDKNEKV